MKTKESIEETERHIKNYTIFNKAIEKEDGFPTDFQIKRLDYYESILSALSSTIPRETAAQLPEVEDSDGWNDVLAFNAETDKWEIVQYDDVESSYDGPYTFWLPMPAAPEVEK